jgi:light-regulated signal transduction histidine kinase (bacteriophytochrome)
MTSEAPQIDLTNCDREPIHVPGAIQPHGVLLALAEPDLSIAHASVNLGQHTGRSAEDLLGQPLASLLDVRSMTRIRAALQKGNWDELNPLRIVAAGITFDGILHRHGGFAILELEPQTVRRRSSVHHILRPALTSLQSAASLPDLYRKAVEAVQRMTRFERVMLYRFDPKTGHGTVEAEARIDGLDSYLGLHYPASDIPRQARELYLRNWLRIIPDARYAPQRLISAPQFEDGPPLDLTFAVLRSVSPIHLEYLANMGVRASMSVSLIVRNRLWGLIACLNHSGPLLLPYELRSACEVLGRLASVEIDALGEREAAAFRDSRRAMQAALLRAMQDSKSDEDVLRALLRVPDQLLRVVDAAGAAVVTGDRCGVCGEAPAADRILEIAAALDKAAGRSLFATESLSAIVPAAAAAKDVASGVATFALPGVSARRLLWFRGEHLRSVSWGGDPTKPASGGATRLHPRRSFELWKEQVQLQSVPWTPAELEAAEDLRRHVVEVDLARQVVREQQAVRARDELIAVVSHDLRNPLFVVQIEAMQLPSLAERGDGWSRVRSAAERIERSVEQMDSLISNLLDLAKIHAGRFAIRPSPQSVREMLKEAFLILRPLAEHKRVSLEVTEADDVWVNADRDRFFYVLSNLVGNAVRFTPSGGSITVAARADARRGEASFTVTDTGPGIHPDELELIFGRYWQSRRGSDEDGTGLGLYIVRGIVEMHGGRAWATSTVGQGATFHFTLPLAEREGVGVEPS